MLRRKFCVEITDCMACKVHSVRLDYKNVVEGGEIYRFDLCMDCEDIATRSMTADEGQMTLLRLADFNDVCVYDEEEQINESY